VSQQTRETGTIDPRSKTTTRRPGDAHRDAGRAASNSDRPPEGLTRNESLVWGALSEFGAPMKAYEILDNLKSSGVRAPMTVYRALEGLESKGVVHKLEGINAFVVCNHDGPHKLQAFMVCEACARVSEIDIAGLETLVGPMTRKTGFAMEVARLEIRGRCADCV